jgi:hypothetical protein
MNEPRETHDLDHALRGWARRRRTAKDFDGLLKRIVAACGDPGAVDRPPASADTPRLRRIVPGPVTRSAMGGAAATLVAAMLYVGFRDRPDHVVPPDVTPQYAWLQESQLRAKTALLREMDRLFEDRLQWIAETDGRVVLQVQQDGRDRAAAPSEAADVAVRMIVVWRGPKSSRWTPVWSVDVIARQEQVTSLTSANADLPPGTEFSLWAFAVDDNAIAVDSRLSLAEHSLEVESSDVQRPGVPVSVHEVRERGQQYRVFQTIAML